MLTHTAGAGGNPGGDGGKGEGGVTYGAFGGEGGFAGFGGFVGGGGSIGGAGGEAGGLVGVHFIEPPWHMPVYGTGEQKVCDGSVRWQKVVIVGTAPSMN